MLNSAGHLRCFAKQHFKRQVNRPVLKLRVIHGKVAIISGFTQNGKEAAFTLAKSGKPVTAFRCDCQHITLLRLVAPDLHRAHTRLHVVYGTQIQPAATTGIMDQFRHSVGESTRSNVMNKENRVLITHLPTAIQHLLASALHLRITSLNRIKIERFSIGAGIHARCRTATQADQHGRSAQLNNQRARWNFTFMDMAGINIAHAASQHDRLMIAAKITLNLLLIGTEIAADIGTAKLVIECRRTNRTIDHDIQSRCNAFRFAELLLPRLLKTRNLQVGDRETA